MIMQNEHRRIGVIGLGSVLMGDDAVGPAMIERLKKRYCFSDNVTLLEIGTPGPDFSICLATFDSVVIVDSTRTDGLPGEIQFFDRKGLMEDATEQRLCPHDPNLKEALMTADFEGTAPEEVELIGIVPQVTELGTRLSDPVEAGLPDLEEAVVDAIRHTGGRCQRIFSTKPTTTWWQAG